jgi:ectoine hydroxylase-related dioxygenase (phytanoyl-CoA dioxygenase family)
MMSFWIALEDIDERLGCLKLTPADRVEPSAFKSMNAPSELYAHQPDGDRHILGEVAEKLAASMQPVPVRRGEILLFDSFQVHGSMPNRTDRTRRAMKLAVGEAKSMHKYLVTLKDLENPKLSRPKQVPLLKRLKRIFS